MDPVIENHPSCIPAEPFMHNNPVVTTGKRALNCLAWYFQSAAVISVVNTIFHRDGPTQNRYLQGDDVGKCLAMLVFCKALVEAIVQGSCWINTNWCPWWGRAEDVDQVFVKRGVVAMPVKIWIRLQMQISDIKNWLQQWPSVCSSKFQIRWYQRTQISVAIILKIIGLPRVTTLAPSRKYYETIKHALVQYNPSPIDECSMNLQCTLPP